MPARRLIPLLAVLWLVAVSAKKYDPFAVPRDSVVARVHTIVLRPAQFEGVEPSALESVQARFDSLAATELEGGGFKVVHAPEWNRVQNRMRDSLGAMFDPATGKPDSAKAALLRQLVVADLHGRLDVDAVFTPHFDRRQANFNAGVASWDGVSQTIRKKGLMGFLGGSQSSGRVSAISYVAELVDLERNLLYLDGGGLQCLVKLGDPSRGNFVDVPTDSLYSDPERNQRAVRVALAALTLRNPKQP
jgi:hypothetical protein